jgi:hypothetical protein
MDCFPEYIIVNTIKIVDENQFKSVKREDTLSSLNYPSIKTSREKNMFCKNICTPTERKRDIEVAIIRMVINDARIARFLLNGMA